MYSTDFDCIHSFLHPIISILPAYFIYLGTDCYIVYYTTLHYYIIILLPVLLLPIVAFGCCCRCCCCCVCLCIYRNSPANSDLLYFFPALSGFGPVQMSPKPEPLSTSSSAVEREHHPISHSSIQSLPIPTAPSNNRFGASLPALQDPRCVPTIFSFTQSLAHSFPPSLTHSSHSPISHFRDVALSFRAIKSCWCLSRDSSSKKICNVYFFSLREADDLFSL